MVTSKLSSTGHSGQRRSSFTMMISSKRRESTLVNRRRSSIMNEGNTLNDWAALSDVENVNSLHQPVETIEESLGLTGGPSYTIRSASARSRRSSSVNGDPACEVADHCMSTLMANVRMIEAVSAKAPLSKTCLDLCYEASQKLHTVYTQGRGQKHDLQTLKRRASAIHSVRIHPTILNVMANQNVESDPQAIGIRRGSTCRRDDYQISSHSASNLDDDLDSKSDRRDTQESQMTDNESKSSEILPINIGCDLVSYSPDEEKHTQLDKNVSTRSEQLSMYSNPTKEQIEASMIELSAKGNKISSSQRSFIKTSNQRRQSRVIDGDRKSKIISRLRSAIHIIGIQKYIGGDRNDKIQPEVPHETESQRFQKSQQRLLRERNALINSLVEEAVESDTVWMIHPEQSELMAWNALLVVLWFGVVIAIPFSFGFGSAPQPWLIMLCDALFIFDVFIGFITGYIDGPLICMNSKKVARKYLRTYFIWDAIAALPFGALSLLYPQSMQARRAVLHILEILKCIKVPKLNREVVRPLFERAIDCHFVSRVSTSLLELLSWFGIVIHWLGACYWCISRYTEPEWKGDYRYNENTWKDTIAYKRGFCPHYKLHDRPLADQWVASIHWAAYSTYSGLPMTQGTRPLKPLQSAFQTVCLMLGMLVLASTIGAVGAVIDELRGGDRHKQEMLKDLDRFFSVRNVPEDVRITIRRYILFLHERRILTSFSSTKRILDQLPTELRGHVVGGAKYAYLRAPGQIYALLDDRLTRIVSTRMFTSIYHPLQIACSQGDICTGVQFIVKGSILLFVRAQPWPKALRFLGRNETFGEETFLLNRIDPYHSPDPASLYSAVARDFTEVFLLRYADIVELRIVYPPFRQVFDKVANQNRDALCFEVASKVLRPWCMRCFARKRFNRHPSTSTHSSSDSQLNTDETCNAHAEHYTAGASLPVALRRNLEGDFRDPITKRNSLPYGNSKRRQVNTRKKKGRHLNNRLAPFGSVVSSPTPTSGTTITSPSYYHRKEANCEAYS